MSCHRLRDVGPGVECIISAIAEWIYGPLADGLESLFELMVTGEAPQSKPGELTFYGEPTQGTWQAVWEATWIGSGNAWMLVIGLVLVVVGAQIRSVLSIGGFGQMSKRRRNSRIGKSLILLLFWYPIATGWLHLIEFMSVLFAPTKENYSAMIDGMFRLSTTEIGRRAQGSGGSVDPQVGELVLSSGFLLLGLVILAIAIFLLVILLMLKDFLILFFVWTIPIAIAFWAWEVPWLSDRAQQVSMMFIPLSFIPVPLALLTRLFVIAVGEDFLGSIGPYGLIVAPIIYSVVSLAITWKLLSEGAPLAAKATKVGAGLALAGGLAGAGAGRFAVASAARGNLSKGITRGVLSTQYGPEATIQGDVGQDAKSNTKPNP